MTPDPPFAADPLNPTGEELAAAIQRGLADGSLIDAADWMERQRELDDPDPETVMDGSGVPLRDLEACERRMDAELSMDRSAFGPQLPTTADVQAARDMAAMYDLNEEMEL